MFNLLKHILQKWFLHLHIQVHNQNPNNQHSNFHIQPCNLVKYILQQVLIDHYQLRHLFNHYILPNKIHHMFQKLDLWNHQSINTNLSWLNIKYILQLSRIQLNSYGSSNHQKNLQFLSMMFPRCHNSIYMFQDWLNCHLDLRLG